jgi:hypothetical protein
VDLASPLANDNPGLPFPPADAAYPFVIHRNTVAAIGQGVQQLLVKLSPNLATRCINTISVSRIRPEDSRYSNKRPS